MGCYVKDTINHHPFSIIRSYKQKGRPRNGQPVFTSGVADLTCFPLGAAEHLHLHGHGYCHHWEGGSGFHRLKFTMSCDKLQVVLSEGELDTDKKDQDE